MHGTKPQKRYYLQYHGGSWYCAPAPQQNSTSPMLSTAVPGIGCTPSYDLIRGCGLGGHKSWMGWNVWRATGCHETIRKSNQSRCTPYDLSCTLGSRQPASESSRDTAPHNNTAQRSTAQHSAAQYNPARHDTTRHDTTQHNTLWSCPSTIQRQPDMAVAGNEVARADRIDHDRIVETPYKDYTQYAPTTCYPQ